MHVGSAPKRMRAVRCCEHHEGSTAPVEEDELPKEKQQNTKHCLKNKIERKRKIKQRNTEELRFSNDREGHRLLLLKGSELPEETEHLQHGSRDAGLLPPRSIPAAGWPRVRNSGRKPRPASDGRREKQPGRTRSCGSPKSLPTAPDGGFNALLKVALQREQPFPVYASC